SNTGEAGLRTYVYRLKHASAEELATTLSELFGIQYSGSSGRARVQSLEDRSLSRTLGAFRRRETDALNARRGMGLPFLVPDVVGPQTPDTTGGGGIAARTTIVADLATNALVIRTAPPNFAVLRETIQSLDIRPPQVLLECLIVEVTLDRSTELGINWSVFKRIVNGRDSTAIEAGHVPGRFNSDSLLARAGDAFIRVTYLNDVDVRAVVRAISARNNVRVLATPHVLALNNEEARILVGSQVPFNQSTRTGLTEVVDRLVQYRDVGTQLTIVPTINEDRYVTVRILQEVSALTNQTLAAALDAPIIRTREAETSAIVGDGQTIVIGGLISEGRETTESGVPVLKDLPLIGALFRNRFSSRERTELAIFVTPRVVVDDGDAQRLLDTTRTRLPESRKEFPGRLEELRGTPAAPPGPAPATPPSATTPVAPPGGAEQRPR
ncbi:MAG TPA: secretin N-terminal domain-containing protein, partial [Gemmatimonadaceae bacterium]|nr:secretin N-terminal domain-containing protein [Gemmatimonadaceae bacterium]